MLGIIVAKNMEGKEERFALTGVAQWAGCRLTKQKVASSFPGQVPSLGYCASLSHGCSSPCLPPLSLKINLKQILKAFDTIVLSYI